MQALETKFICWYKYMCVLVYGFFDVFVFSSSDIVDYIHVRDSFL